MSLLRRYQTALLEATLLEKFGYLLVTNLETLYFDSVLTEFAGGLETLRFRFDIPVCTPSAGLSTRRMRVSQHLDALAPDFAMSH